MKQRDLFGAVKPKSYVQFWRRNEPGAEWSRPLATFEVPEGGMTREFLLCCLTEVIDAEPVKQAGYIYATEPVSEAAARAEAYKVGCYLLSWEGGKVDFYGSI